MDCTDCNWFRNISPKFLEVVWMDFGKEFPANTLQLWSRFICADSLEVKVVGQLKGRMGLDSLDSHPLKRHSSFDFANFAFKQYHTTFLVKYCNLFFGHLVKSTDRLILLGLRLSHKAPFARSWSWGGRLDPLIRGLLAIAKGFPHFGKTGTCWGWYVLIGFCQVPG